MIYRLASIDFYGKFIRASIHLLDSTFGGADYIPAEYSTSSADHASRDTLLFKCPPWLLRDATCQDQLSSSIERLAASLDTSQNAGCLIDEHMRRNRISYSKEYLRRKGATAAQLRLLHSSSRVCAQLFAMDTSEYNRLNGTNLANPIGTSLSRFANQALFQKLICT